MNEKKIYRIQPLYKSFVWAGRKLIDKYNIDTSLENVGTIYNVISVPGELDNPVIGTGLTLTEFYNQNKKELFDCSDRLFPVRMTFTCNESYQSFQLHPGDEYALEHEGTRGKVSGAVALFPEGKSEPRRRRFGCKAKSLEEFRELVEKEDWDNLFDSIETAEGHYLHTPAGVIHGGKGGGSISVTFGTNSDITYRFFDYHRDDPKRPLDMKKVCDCVNIPEVELVGGIKPQSVFENGIERIDYYEKSGEYVAKRLKVQGEGTFEYDRFAFYACADGEGFIDDQPIKAGETLFVPCNFGKITLKGNMDLCFLSYFRED